MAVVPAHNPFCISLLIEQQYGTHCGQSSNSLDSCGQKCRQAGKGSRQARCLTQPACLPKFINFAWHKYSPRMVVEKKKCFFSQMRNVMFPLLFCWECALCLALSPFCVPVLAQHHSLRMVVENGCQMRNVMFSLLFCGACSLCLSSSRPVCPGQFLCAVLNVMEKSRRCVCGRGRII